MSRQLLKAVAGAMLGVGRSTRSGAQSVWGARRRLALVTLVLLSATLSGVGVGSVAAEDEQIAQCDNLDQFLWTITGGHLENPIAVNEERCDPTRVSQRAQAILDAEDNQTAINLYDGLKAESVAYGDFTATQKNGQNLSRAYFNDQMQLAVAAAYENNSTKAGAEDAYRERMTDVFAKIEHNYLNRLSNSGVYWAEMRERAQAEGVESVTSPDGDYDVVDFSIELANGTNKTYQFVGVVSDGSSSVGAMIPLPYDRMTGMPDANYSTYSYGASLTNPQIINPEDDVLSYYLYTDSDNSHWQYLQQRRQTELDRASTFVDATYDEFKNGNVSTEDITDCGVTASMAGSDGLSGALGTVACLGFDTPDLNDTGTMDIRYNGSNVTGLVFAEKVPQDQWQANMTYNATDIPGIEFLATVDGNYSRMDGEFTIQAIRNKNGTEVESVNVSNYGVSTRNGSDYRASVERRTELVIEIQDRQAKGGGGGDGDGGSGLDGASTPLIIGLLAGIGVLVLLGRQ